MEVFNWERYEKRINEHCEYSNDYIFKVIYDELKKEAQEHIDKLLEEAREEVAREILESLNEVECKIMGEIRSRPSQRNIGKKMCYRWLMICIEQLKQKYLKEKQDGI